MTVRETVEESPLSFRNPENAKAFWDFHVATRPDYDPEKEWLIVLVLNTKHELKSYQVVTIGILDASLVHPREVFRPAVADAV